MQIKGIIFMCFIALVLSQRKEFCELFGENGFEIDYLYESFLNGGPENYYHLFIGDHYWTIEEPGVSFHRNDTKSRIITDWFGKDYKSPFLWEFDINNRKELLTGLLRKEKNQNGSHTIEWAPIDIIVSDGYKVLKKSDDYERYLINKSDIIFSPDFTPKFGVLNVLDFMMFYDVKTIEENKYLIIINWFDFNVTTGEPKIGQIFSFKFNHKLIGLIWEVWFLFEENKSLYFCYWNSNETHYFCLTEPKLLINCSHFEENTTTVPTTTSTSFWIFGPIFLVLAVLAMIGLCILVYYVYPPVMRSQDNTNVDPVN